MICYITPFLSVIFRIRFFLGHAVYIYRISQWWINLRCSTAKLGWWSYTDVIMVMAIKVNLLKTCREITVRYQPVVNMLWSSYISRAMVVHRCYDDQTKTRSEITAQYQPVMDILWSSCISRVMVVYRCYDDWTKTCREITAISASGGYAVIFPFRGMVVHRCYDYRTKTCREITARYKSVADMLWSSCIFRVIMVMVIHRCYEDQPRRAGRLQHNISQWCICCDLPAYLGWWSYIDIWRSNQDVQGDYSTISASGGYAVIFLQN